MRFGTTETPTVGMVVVGVSPSSLSTIEYHGEVRHTGEMKRVAHRHTWQFDKRVETRMAKNSFAKLPK